jgi:hypothetical protein
VQANSVREMRAMQDSRSASELREALRQFVEGYTAAAEFLAGERARRLKALSVEEARAEYDALCATWAANPYREGMELLEQRRVKHLVELRRRLNLAAGRSAE